MIYKEKGIYADQDFLNIFSFKLNNGDINQALVEPFSVLLSETLSVKLFPDENPVGKTLLLDKKYTLKITGTYDDLPKNAHLRPDYIISFQTIERLWNTNNLFERWNHNAFYTYVLLKEGSDYKNLELNIRYILTDKIQTDIRQLYLRPLNKLYLASTNNNYLIVVYLLGILSFFILMLASINSMNLSIASSTTRMKEIGIKKIIGSSRKQLIMQIFLEAFLITIFSFIVAIILVELFLPIFNDYTNKEITFKLLFSHAYIIYILLFILVISISTSIYPAWLITAVRSVELFKGKITRSRGSGVTLKKLMVGFQYTITIVLITMTVLFIKQIHFMSTKNIGFDKENLLFTEVTVSSPDVSIQKIKNRLSSYPEIESIAVSQGFPIHSSRYTDAAMIDWEGGSRDQVTEVRVFWVSYDYVKTLGLEILEGRDFSLNYPSDMGNACLINKTAVRRFGWEYPVGKFLKDRHYNVVGVIKDYHFHDIYNIIKPMALLVKPDSTVLKGHQYFAFRISPESEKKSIENITSILDQLFPEDPYEIQLFTDYFNTDQHFAIFATIKNIFIFFSIIAISLSVLGVFSLVTHTLNRKTKEIAIKKINGCSSLTIFQSIVVEYIILIVMASFIGSIVAKWLSLQIPIYYRSEQGIWDFSIAIIISLIITLLSITHKTLKEATRNLVESLRYE